MRRPSRGHGQIKSKKGLGIGKPGGSFWKPGLFYLGPGGDGWSGLNPEAVLERPEGRPYLLHLRQPSLLSQNAKCGDKNHNTMGTYEFLGLIADLGDNEHKKW